MNITRDINSLDRDIASLQTDIIHVKTNNALIKALIRLSVLENKVNALVLKAINDLDKTNYLLLKDRLELCTKSIAAKNNVITPDGSRNNNTNERNNTSVKKDRKDNHSDLPPTKKNRTNSEMLNEKLSWAEIHHTTASPQELIDVVHFLIEKYWAIYDNALKKRCNNIFVDLWMSLLKLVEKYGDTLSDDQKTSIRDEFEKMSWKLPFSVRLCEKIVQKLSADTIAGIKQKDTDLYGLLYRYFSATQELFRR